MKPLVLPCSRALWCIGLVLHAELQWHPEERDRSSPAGKRPGCPKRWLFPVSPGCHTYHDHSNHDSSDTDQVELPGEELIDFFVAVCVLRQRSTPVSLLSLHPPPAPRKAGQLPPGPTYVPRPWHQDSQLDFTPLHLSAPSSRNSKGRTKWEPLTSFYTIPK